MSMAFLPFSVQMEGTPKQRGGSWFPIHLWTGSCFSSKHLRRPNLGRSKWFCQVLSKHSGPGYAKGPFPTENAVQLLYLPKCCDFQSSVSRPLQFLRSSGSGTPPKEETSEKQEGYKGANINIFHMELSLLSDFVVCLLGCLLFFLFFFFCVCVFVCQFFFFCVCWIICFSRTYLNCLNDKYFSGRHVFKKVPSKPNFQHLQHW